MQLVWLKPFEIGHLAQYFLQLALGTVIIFEDSFFESFFYILLGKGELLERSLSHLSQC